MFDSILIVCTGNICRSPIGEQLLKDLLPGRRINSAGVRALVGNPADSMAIKIAAINGLSLAGHIARQLTSELCIQNNLILVMEKKHIETVCKYNPESRGKTMLFGHWLEHKEIDDPYRKSQESFEYIYKLLDKAAHEWAKAITK
jgi:protein-tyrosine phosphatase